LFLVCSSWWCFVSFAATEELEGLPEDFVKALPVRDDRHVVSLKYPELLPVMRYARREQTRQAMDKANGTHCVADNAPLLEEVVALRHGAI
jgi:Zn-dependent oligopeptidase